MEQERPTTSDQGVEHHVWVRSYSTEHSGAVLAFGLILCAYLGRSSALGVSGDPTFLTLVFTTCTLARTLFPILTPISICHISLGALLALRKFEITHDEIASLQDVCSSLARLSSQAAILRQWTLAFTLLCQPRWILWTLDYYACNQVQTAMRPYNALFSRIPWSILATGRICTKRYHTSGATLTTL